MNDDQLQALLTVYEFLKTRNGDDVVSETCRLSAQLLRHNFQNELWDASMLSCMEALTDDDFNVTK